MKPSLVGVLWAIGLLAACTAGTPEHRGTTPEPEPTRRAQTSVAALPTPTPTRTYAPGWSAIHADAANSDYSHVQVPDGLALNWQRKFDGAIKVGSLEWTINVGPTSSPDGVLYLTTSVPGCHFQALDAGTGETLWCQDSVGLQAVISSALIDAEGRVYLADNLAMRSFDSGGQLLWETPIVGVPLSAQFTPAGNVIFITHVGIAYVLDRETGDTLMEPLELVPGATWDGVGGLWDCARGLAGCPSANTIAVDGAAGRVIFTFWEPGAPQAGVRAMLLSEDARTARLVPLWENVSLPGGSASSPVLSSDGTRVYVTDNVESIHALDAATGEVVWSVAFGAASGGSPSLSPHGILIPAGGDLQAIRDDGTHGSVLWRWEGVANRGIATQAAGSRAFATVPSSRPGAHQFANDLVVVDTLTGAELERIPIEGVTVFSIGITVGLDGTVYVPFITGHIAAFTAAPQ